MQKSLEILLEVEKATGNGSQKIKQDLISGNLSPELEYILSICFDPFVTTKLNKLEVVGSESNIINANIFPEFKDLCEELKSAPAANDVLRLKAANLVANSGYNEEIKKVLSKVLIKRMNIGIGAKLINKAVGKELIPDPSLMLAKDDISRIDKWRKIICEFKYDGVRVIAKIDKTGGVTFFTRGFNELPARFLQKITEEIKRLVGDMTDIFVDGELTDFARTTVSGKVTSILSGKPLESIGDTFLFNIFDIENSQTLVIGKGTTKYPERRSLLEQLFENKKFDHLVLGTKWEITDKDEIWSIYKHIVEVEKGEGYTQKYRSCLYM